MTDNGFNRQQFPSYNPAMCLRIAVRLPDGRWIEVDARAAKEYRRYHVWRPVTVHGPAKPQYNIGPGQLVDIIKFNDGARELSPARWGFIPSWAKEKPKLRPGNARGETVAKSGLFRKSFQSRRCLILADGFYEWQGAKPPRQPYFVHLKTDEPFAFAGLWDRWTPPDGEPEDTFTLITTTPNELMAPIHNRMPVILHDEDYDEWLRGDDPGELIKQFEPDLMDAYPISTQVNSIKNDGPDLLKPLVRDGLF